MEGYEGGEPDRWERETVNLPMSAINHLIRNMRAFK